MPPVTPPRGIRNANPGNIRRTGIGWMGERGPVSDQAFEEFISAFFGIRALCALLLSYQRTHGLRTVRELIGRWAPPVENDTGAYVRFVAEDAGMDPDMPLSLDREEILVALARAIMRHENGKNPATGRWWSDEQYSAALVLGAARAALGTGPNAEPLGSILAGPGAAEPAIAPADGPTARPVQDRPSAPQDAQERPGTPGDRYPTAPDPVRDFNAYNPLADLGRAPMPLPIVPIVAALLPQIIAALPDLARIISRTPPAPGGDKPTVPERNVQVLERVGEIITAATGEPTVEGAVRKLQVDPAARETAAREVRMSFPELLELSRFDEDSRREARRFGAEMLSGASPNLRALGYGAVLFTIALIVVAGGGWMLREVLLGGETPAETKGMITGGILTAIASVLAFFFGSSASSRGKDQALQAIAERR